MLFHARASSTPLETYAAVQLARCWAEDGIEIVLARGTKRFIPGDLCFLHVDLSLVPEDYLALADRYPKQINRSVTDIRKSTISRNLVARGDGWRGPVIVKSDLNCAGGPERAYLGQRSGSFASKDDYAVYRSVGEVPEPIWTEPTAVVERFLPELEDDLFHVRTFQFLGDRWDCYRTASRSPIVSFGSRVRPAELIEPDPAILAWRERLGFDFGKFDYVVHDGEVVLLDANKTPGTSPDHLATPEVRAVRRNRAAGIWHYLQ